MNYLPEIAVGGCLLTMIVGMVVAYKLKEMPGDAEARRIRFAAATMTGVLIVFVLGMSFYVALDPRPETGKDIFESCQKVLVPIVTLVLGYWFGAKNS